MTDEPDLVADPSRGNRSLPGTSTEASGSRPDDRLNTLQTFATAQRRIAGSNFAALAQAQYAIGAYAPQIAEVAATREAIAKNFAGSIDFSGIATIHKQLEANRLNMAAAVQQWTKFLTQAIDYPTLRAAVALVDYSGMSQAMEVLKGHPDVIKHLSQRITSWFSDIDLSWLEVDRWLPGNLHGLQDEDLDLVASVALDEGIPLSWVPCTDIVIALINADGPQERLWILDDRTDDILGDCEAVLAPISHEWAVECRCAITALRRGLHGPAQSHASNIVDSIVLAVLGRGDAVDRAQEDFDDQFLQVVAEHLTLRPLFRAFAKWYPHTGNSPPPHFARHAISHAVGHSGLFDPLYALVGIMLATSLTVQFQPDTQEGAES